MHIKHFTMFPQRVPDPMRPGRSAVVGKLMDSASVGLTYTDASGKSVEVEPDDHGWFDVPHEVGVQLCRFRDKGSGFYAPGDVADQVRLGALEERDLPSSSAPKRAAAAKKKVAASSED